MHAKYERRVNRLNDGLFAPELTQLIEPLGIAFLRPDRIKESDPDVGAIVHDVFEALGQHLTISMDDREQFLTTLTLRTKSGENLTNDEQLEQSLIALFNVLDL